MSTIYDYRPDLERIGATLNLARQFAYEGRAEETLKLIQVTQVLEEEMREQLAKSGNNVLSTEIERPPYWLGMKGCETQTAQWLELHEAELLRKQNEKRVYMSQNENTAEERAPKPRREDDGLSGTIEVEEASEEYRQCGATICHNED